MKFQRKKIIIVVILLCVWILPLTIFAFQRESSKCSYNMSVCCCNEVGDTILSSLVYKDITKNKNCNCSISKSKDFNKRVSPFWTTQSTEENKKQIISPIQKKDKQECTLFIKNKSFYRYDLALKAHLPLLLKKSSLLL
jgi:hypothetical protein